MRLTILLFFLFYFKTVFNDTLCPQQSFDVSYNEQITVTFIPNCDLSEYPSSTVITIRPTTTIVSGSLKYNDVSVNTATNYPIEASFVYTAPRDGTNPTFTLSYVLYFDNVRNNTLYNIIFKNNPCYLTCMSCNFQIFNCGLVYKSMSYIVYYFFFYIMLCFFFNLCFITNTDISLYYHSSKTFFSFLLSNLIMKAFYTAMVVEVLGYLLFLVIENYTKRNLETFFNENKKSRFFIKEVRDEFFYFKIKVIFIVSSLFFEIFIVYSAIIFSSVYKHFYLLWIINSCFSFIFVNGIQFIVIFILSIMRMIAITNNMGTCFNCVQFFN